jgi:hypothetical protein
MRPTAFAAAILALALSSPAMAAQADANTSKIPAPDALTINDCMTALTGLTALDGYKVIANAGKPTEEVVLAHYKFARGTVQFDIGHDLSMLQALQKETQAASTKIVQALGNGKDLAPGTPEYLEWDRQLKEMLAKPCGLSLTHIPMSDLKPDENNYPGSVLGALDRIIDR